MSKKDLQFSRQDLYKLVWTEPILKISKRLDIKEYLIRQKCKEYNIPTPDSGYWSKLKFNKKVEVTPLPENSDKLELIELIDDKTHLNESIVKEFALKIAVPKKLKKPHPLIVNAKENFLRHLNIHSPNSELCGTDIFNISLQISPSTLNRSLTIFDTVIKTLIANGHKVEIKERKTIAIISEIEVPIRLRERTKRIVNKDPKFREDRYNYIATGDLIIVIELKSWKRTEISDNQNSKLENKIDQIIGELIRQAIEEKNSKKEYELRRSEKKRAQEIKTKKAQNINSELERFKQILISNDRWHKAKIIRQYLSEYEQYFLSKNELDDEKIEWLKWAQKKADWYDPFIETEDETLKGIDRDKLEPLPIKNRYFG